MKKTILVSLVLLFAVSLNASAQMTPLASGPETKRLEKLAGVWKTHVKVESSQWGAGGESDCISTNSMIEGVWLHQTLNGTMPEMGPYAGVGMMTWDAAAGNYVTYWFDNYTPAATEYRGNLIDENTILFTRDSVYEGQRIWERHSYHLGDGASYSFVMEMSLDGKNFFPSMRIDYTR